MDSLLVQFDFTMSFLFFFDVLHFLNNLNCQIKLDFSSNSEKLGMVFDNSKTS